MKREDRLEKYFKNTLKALLKEAVERGIVKKDDKVEEIINF
jgi:hypothetical protein